MSVINIITKKKCQNKFHRRKQNDKLFKGRGWVLKSLQFNQESLKKKNLMLGHFVSSWEAGQAKKVSHPNCI